MNSSRSAWYFFARSDVSKKDIRTPDGWEGKIQSRLSRQPTRPSTKTGLAENVDAERLLGIRQATRPLCDPMRGAGRGECRSRAPPPCPARRPPRAGHVLRQQGTLVAARPPVAVRAFPVVRAAGSGSARLDRHKGRSALR